MKERTSDRLWQTVSGRFLEFDSFQMETYPVAISALLPMDAGDSRR
jgi:hypothetical protein